MTPFKSGNLNPEVLYCTLQPHDPSDNIDHIFTYTCERYLAIFFTYGGEYTLTINGDYTTLLTSNLANDSWYSSKIGRSVVKIIKVNSSVTINFHAVQSYPVAACYVIGL